MESFQLFCQLKVSQIYFIEIWILLENYFWDSVDIVINYTQNPPFFTFFERLHSQGIFFQFFFSLWLLREGYTVKSFFQSISWNTIAGSFHETWNTFMKYFYLSIQHPLRMFLINKKIEFIEKRYLVKFNRKDIV